MIMVSFLNIFLVFSITSAGIFLGVGGIATFVYAVKRKNRLIYLFSAMWIFMSFSMFTAATAHFFYSPFLIALAIIPQLIGVPCIIIFIELSRKERVSPLKFTILSIIEITLLAATFLLPESENFEVIQGYGVHNKGLIRIAQLIFLLYFVSQYFLWSLQTWRKAPLEYKRRAIWLFVGSIMYSFIAVLLYAIGTVNKLYNPLAFFANGIGAFITIVIVLKTPKIIYILPFKAYRIIVIDTNEGIALFRYDWAEIGRVEENIFSTVLQAVGSILDEILKKGEVREIQMDRAILLMHNDKIHPLASVLVTSKSTKSLRYALRTFNEEFISSFYRDGINLHEVSQFKDADKLVEKIFDFVPLRKKQT
ncbi:MAG: hypothetical protein ACW98A_13525 [Candidatus Hodarchaeales archaeon]|jgi:hypothetical protein